MPRVLHLYKDLFPPVYGGIEVVLGKLASRQVPRGWDVSIAVSGPVDRDWADEKGIRVIQVGEWGRILSNPISPGFLKVLKEEPYDLLHLHLPCPTAVLATLATGREGVPWFASYQSDIVRQRLTGRLYAPFQRRFLSKCSAIFVSSQNLLNSSPVLQLNKDRCRLVPLGILPDEPTQEDRAQAERIRAEYAGSRLVLFVGRFRWYKGLHVLVDAMEEIDATLLVVGSGTRAQEKNLRSRVASLRHPDRVRFLGSVDRLEPLLVAADLFCLPSTHRAEAFGYVLLEAFRAGLPVVTTELRTGTSYVNQDGVTGFVVPPGDPKALAEAINRILSDSVLREQFGDAAKSRVTKEFGLDGMVEGILEGYSEALQREVK